MNIKKLLEDLAAFDYNVNIIQEDKNQYGELEELKFSLDYKGNTYYIDVHCMDLDEEDNYHLHVYTGEEMLDEQEIADAWFDSSFGSTGGDELNIVLDHSKGSFTDEVRETELENAIMDVVAEHMVEVTSHDE